MPDSVSVGSRYVFPNVASVLFAIVLSSALVGIQSEPISPTLIHRAENEKLELIIKFPVLAFLEMIIEGFAADSHHGDFALRLVDDSNIKSLLLNRAELTV